MVSSEWTKGERDPSTVTGVPDVGDTVCSFPTLSGAPGPVDTALPPHSGQQLEAAGDPAFATRLPPLRPPDGSTRHLGFAGDQRRCTGRPTWFELREFCLLERGGRQTFPSSPAGTRVTEQRWAASWPGPLEWQLGWQNSLGSGCCAPSGPASLPATLRGRGASRGEVGRAACPFRSRARHPS